jgi:RHS repeat-associated protein
VYIYLSNEETTPVEVYFDDFKVTHTKSPVIQVDDYYPFGLSISGLSYQRENSAPQDLRYNGKELQDELGLGWLDYGARMHMAEIGRWGAIDGLTEKYNASSPYTYGLNNPVLIVDVDGNDVVVSIANTEISQGFLKYAASEEGRAYLSKYAKANEKITVGGETIVLNQDGKDGVYSSHTLNIRDGKLPSWGVRGRTKHHISNRTGRKEYTLRQGFDTFSAIDVGKDPKFRTEIILNSTLSDRDEAAYVLGHESFLHDRQMDKMLGAFKSYQGTKMTQEDATVLSHTLNNLVNQTTDHDLLKVNGEAVSLERFVKELDKMYKTNKFSDELKKDRKNP